MWELAQQVREAGPDPAAWRSAALLGLTRLLRAQVGLTADIEDVLPGRVPRPTDAIDVGWADPSVRRRYYDYYRSGEAADDPGMGAVVAAHRRARFATWARRQGVEDRTWYASPSVSEARRMGDVDDFVCSTVTARPGVLHGFVLYRPWGDRPFEAREVRLLRLFHAHVLRLTAAGQLHNPGDAGNRTDDGDRVGDRVCGGAALSPRLRQTLDLLLGGDGMKQIARKLGISTHTVNDYTKTLYKRFDVSGRAELQARFRAIEPDGPP